VTNDERRLSKTKVESESGVNEYGNASDFRFTKKFCNQTTFGFGFKLCHKRSLSRWLTELLLCTGLGVQCRSMARLSPMSVVFWLAVRQACRQRSVHELNSTLIAAVD